MDALESHHYHLTPLLASGDDVGGGVEDGEGELKGHVCLLYPN